jgi:demethylmenaquinone methyltransferase/2-methoxy-6-polyprenyl-1,4-benzoquinol methylase
MQPKADFVRVMFARIARCYDFMNRLMALGRDQAWRRYVARQAALPQGELRPEASSRACPERRRRGSARGAQPEGLALDVATGTADLALALARRYPHVHVVGVDFCPEMVEIGRAKVATAGENPRIRFVIGDALQLPFTDGCFDAVTSGFALRNVADISQAFTEMGRVAKAGGRVVCLEIAKPTLPIFRQLFHIYFYHLVPLLGSVLAGQGEAYRCLPHSLTHFPSPGELKAVMEGAGLNQVGYRRLMLGTVAVHVGIK